MSLSQAKEISGKKSLSKELWVKEGILCNKKIYKGVRKGQISPLMKSLKKDVKPYLKKGPIAEKSVYSQKNYVSMDVFRNNNAIFRMGKT